MSGTIIALILFGVGIAIGFMISAIFVSKSDADDYEEGYQDGYQDGKDKMRDSIDSLCSHCAYRGRPND